VLAFILRSEWYCRTFRSLCKHFQVTDLPACVLLDVNGHALTQGSLKALEVTRKLGLVSRQVTELRRVGV
jgi:hypothetical protein